MADDSDYFGADDWQTNLVGGDYWGEMPGIGMFAETPAEAAGKAKLATMADVGRQYEAFRGDSQAGYQQAGANMAGMMGGLNQMVLDNTGYGIDFEAAMAPVTGLGPAAAQAPPPVNPLDPNSWWGGGGSGLSTPEDDQRRAERDLLRAQLGGG